MAQKFAEAYQKTLEQKGEEEIPLDTKIADYMAKKDEEGIRQESWMARAFVDAALLQDLIDDEIELYLIWITRLKIFV